MVRMLVIALFSFSMTAYAYSGRTTNESYRTGTLAAKHTGAYYLTKAGKSFHRNAPIFKARDMRVVKMGRTKAHRLSSTWVLGTPKLASMRGIVLTTVKLKKLDKHNWKGYTDGKTNVSYLIPLRK